jgi:hypothetical protein
MNYGGMSLGHDGDVVLARSIDSLQLANVSFMKFDVQGAERLAIYGARQTIKTWLPVVNQEVMQAYGDEWFDKYAAGIPDLPQEVRAFNSTRFLLELGYTLGQQAIGEWFWYPPVRSG